MGTHPIFESDFDCLTEMSVELFYYAISPPARACELVLMLNKVDFKLTEVDLFKGEQNKPEFLAINPAHCIPTLKDGDFAVWESRAIMQYVMNKFARTQACTQRMPRLVRRSTT